MDDDGSKPLVFAEGATSAERAAYERLFAFINGAWRCQADLCLIVGRKPGLRVSRTFVDVEVLIKANGHNDLLALFGDVLEFSFFTDLVSYFHKDNQLGKSGETFAFPIVSVNNDKFWRARVLVSPYAYANGTGNPGTFSLEVRVLPHTPNPFEDFPFPAAFFEGIQAAASGIVLIGGTAHSGRTTTLASLMLHLGRQPGLNMATVESPVEYVIQPYSMHETTRTLQMSISPRKESWNEAITSLGHRDFDIVGITEVSPFLPDGSVMNLSDPVLALAGNGSKVLTTISGKSFYDVFDRFTFRPNPLDRRAARELAIRHLVAITVQQLVLVKQVGGYCEALIHIGSMLFSDTLRDNLLSAVGRGDETAVRTSLVQYGRDDTPQGSYSFVRSRERLMGLGVEDSLLLLG